MRLLTLVATMFALLPGVAACTGPTGPQITGITPAAGPIAGGTSVTLTGSGFTAQQAGPCTVTFDGVDAANINVAGDTTITCDAPAHAAGAVDVVVSNLRGTATRVGGFEYLGAPTVFSVAPGSGSVLGGQSVTITGSGFERGNPGINSVTFGGVAATNVAVQDDTTLTCDTPAGTTGDADVVVSNVYGAGTLSPGFAYLPQPTVVSVTANGGPMSGGLNVTISGSGFVANGAGACSVTFGATAASNVQVSDDSTLTCDTPSGGAGAGGTTVDVTVSNANGSGTLVSAFTWFAAPTITQIMPPYGNPLGGGSHSITGSGFVNNSPGTNVVTIGGQTATIVSVDSDTQLAVTSPALAYGSYDVVVSNTNGSATLTNGYASRAYEPAADVTMANAQFASPAVVADFNTDAYPDIVFAAEGRIHFRPGDGSGTFTTAGTSLTGGHNVARKLAVADFDHDGDLDVAATFDFITNGSLVVAINDGTGTFTHATGSPFNGTPAAGVCTGDFDRDGWADIAWTRPNDNQLHVWLGLGNVTFSIAPSSPYTLADARVVVSGDVNHDGIPDLAVTRRSAAVVEILLGDGTGAFTAGTPVAVASDPADLTLADVDRDGNLDLVIAHTNSNTLTVRFGDGNAGFATSFTTTVSKAYSLAVTDVDRDGKPDIIVGTTGHDILALLGDGAGNFTPLALDTLNDTVTGIAVGDVDRDGAPDLVASVLSGAAPVKVMRSTLAPTSGTFAAGVNVAINGWRGAVMVSADVDNDGDLDLIVGNQNVLTVSVMFNDGNGSFTAGSSSDILMSAESMVAADFSRDGKLDIAVGGNQRVQFLLGDGTGGFVNYSSVFFSGRTVWSLAVYDYFLNGRPGVLVGTDNVELITTSFVGGVLSFLKLAGTMATRSSSRGLVAADFDRNGRSDFAVLDDVLLEVKPWVQPLGQPLQARAAVPCKPSGRSLVTGDIDRDGRPDVAWVQYSAVRFGLTASNGDFSAVDGPDTAGGQPTALALADVNFDGLLDLVVAEYDSPDDASVGVYHCTGGTTFASPVLLPVDESPVALIVADFNRDGVPDVVTLSMTNDTITFAAGIR
ncbi:MAG: FG-GAP-like repeat-containing protein [Planctomycetota bacterium]